MNWRRGGGWLAGAAAAVTLAGCAELPRNGCPKAGQRATAELVFGRSSDDPAHPSVTEADFTRFLDEEVSPRFPDGLTVIDAQGALERAGRQRRPRAVQDGDDRAAGSP